MSTYTIPLKGDTTENWEESGRVLVKNEVGVERDSNNNVVGIKIGDGVKDWNSLSYVYGQYSETPQRIGTWVDGSPVYRKAFDVLLKDLSTVDYGDILSNSSFYVPTYFGTGAAYPIYAFCAYNWDDNLRVDICTASIGDTSIDFVMPDGAAIPENQSDCTTERYYGYIDFIQVG